ncbi:MAG: hypothetical protein NUV54_02940 [Candidatus Taylorbacteria bacterium]|nr:hypothetical protein [Candidatus Taylorbacteria bacterium]
MSTDLPQVTSIDDTQDSQPKTSEVSTLELGTREGLPIVSSEDYKRLYNTDIRARGEETALTFDFQGYVREDRDGYQKGEYFKDALATNGIRKSETQKGIHVGIDGVDMFGENSRMESTGDVGEYVMYVTLPPMFQEENGLICKYDDCMTVDDYKLQELDDNPSTEELQDFMKRIKVIQEGKGYIVVRLSIDPSEDPHARAKVKIINNKIVKFLEDGGSPTKVTQMVRDLEDELGLLSKENFEDKVKMLEK